MGRPLKPRTHCYKGHEYTPENTEYDKVGARTCLICRKASRAKLAAWRKANGITTKDRQGHLEFYDPYLGYWIYKGMISRCYKPSNPAYSYYGGRGIKMCDRWRYGENGMNGWHCFKEDMGRRPSLQHSIDRIDNDGDYEPSNCRWATDAEQALNRSDNRWITYNGETKALCQWARLYNMNNSTLAGRLNKGMTMHEAVTTPVRKNKKALEDSV